jgi:hypothetical protein
MTIKIRPFALSIALAGAISVPAIAQDNGNRTVEQFTCKDIMRLDDSDRAIAAAFLHGYFLGKSGGTKFNLDALAKQTDGFFDSCLDSPKDKALDVMKKVKQ